ncbi:extracellular calcium-sensing receptor-like [Lissotriton helveticus]
MRADTVFTGATSSQPRYGISTPKKGMYSKEGDAIFGIMAAVHQETTYPPAKFMFEEPPTPRRCARIHTMFYQTVLATVFAISEINRSPSLLPNTSLGFQICDSCFSELGAIEGTLQLLSKGNETIPNYSSLSSPNLIGIIGDGPSAGALSMARILGVSRFPQISYAAALPSLSDKFLYPSFLRTVTSVSFVPHALVQLLLHFGWTWIGILSSNNDLSLEGSQMFKEEAAKNEICFEFFETLPTEPNSAYLNNVIDILQTSSVNVVICFTYAVQITPVLKRLSQQRMGGKIWIAVTTWFPSPVFSRRDLWEALNGTLGLAVYSGHIPGFKKFLDNIHSFKNTDDIFLKVFWEQVFNCKFVNETKSGNITDVDGHCSGTENLESLDASVFEKDDFRYPYSAYKATYSLAKALHDLLHCKSQEGPFTNRSCGDSKDFKPWQILHYLKNVRMETATDTEKFFDSSGDSPPFLDLLYWHMTSNQTSSFVKVGTYDAKAPIGLKLVIDENAILWGGKHTQAPVSVCSESCPLGHRKSTIAGRPKCCFSCVPCPDGSIANRTDSLDCMKCPEDHWSNYKKDKCIPKGIEFLSYAEPLGTILASVAVFLFFNATGVLCIFIMYRNTPVVRANNVCLSYFLLVALMLCFLCSLVFIGMPGRVTCMLRQVIFSVTFSLAISCVMAKTLTVVIAFRATKPNSKLRLWVGSRTSYIIMLVCSVIEFSIGITWLGTSPPFPELNNRADSWKIIAECNEGSIQMFYSTLTFLGLLACISFGIAFMARNLPDSFNEAKFITFSMLVFISVWFSFIPAYLSTKGKYMVAVEIFAILSSGAGLLFCIFSPKIYIIFLRPERNTREHLITKSTETIRAR